MGSVQFVNLYDESKAIWSWCESQNIRIFASYIKLEDNVEADEESRRLPADTEWELADWAFKKIKNRLGPFDIDLFASHSNNKCKKNVSWGRDPDSYAIDAFTLNWTDYYFYAFPPFSLIPRVLQKIISDRAEGVVIVPLWRGQC